MPYLVTRKSVSRELSEDYRTVSHGDFNIHYGGNVEVRQENGKTYLLHGLLYNEKGSNSAGTSIEAFKQSYREDSLEKLEGLYTGIIIENDEIEVFRDIFGAKPVYYSQENDFISLASDIQPLLQTLPRTPKVNREIAADYLAHGLVDHRTETFFQGVNRLKPKKRLIYSEGEIRVEEANCSSREETAELSPLLEENIEKLKPEDDSYYCPVSGGLDSTITASKCREAEHIHLSFQHGTKDERYLPDVKSKYDLDIQKVEVKPVELLEEVNNTVKWHGEPTAFPAIQAQSLLYRNIEDGRTVISGTGADELFFGYPWFLPFYLADKLKDGEVLSFLKEILNYRKSLDLNYLYSLKDILLNGGTTLPSGTEDLVNFESSPVKLQGLDEARRKHLEDFYFPHMLRSVQKHSRQHKVEIRPAFLSQNIFTYSSNLDAGEHFQNGLKKYLLRSGFKEQLPESIYHRKQKTGFVTASNRLYTPSTKRKFLEVFQSDSFRSRELVKSREVLKKLKQSALPFGVAYRFYNFELWMRSFID